MRRGLLQAGLLILVAVVLSQLAATVWTWMWGGSYLQHVGVCTAVVGLLIGWFGGDMVWSRIQTTDERAFLGFGPERYDYTEGEGLTTVGRFLLVGLPLFGIGLVLMAISGS